MKSRSGLSYIPAPAFVWTVPFNWTTSQFGRGGGLRTHLHSKAAPKLSRVVLATPPSGFSKDVTKNLKEMSIHGKNVKCVVTEPIGHTSVPSIIAVSTFIATVWSGSLGSSLAEMTEDPPGTVSEAGTEAVKTATDAVRAVLSDDDLLSKGLFYLAFGLLIYVTTGVIILTINKFVVNRNDKLNRKWVKDRLEGRPVPPNRWLKDPKDAQKFPDDFPVKPMQSISTEEGNRQQRRGMKKSRDKDRPKKSVAKGENRAVKPTTSEKKKKKS